MGHVNFNLVNAATLGTLVPPVGAFAFMPPGLAGAGLYIIFNSNTNNRYVGKSSNLTTRFQPRMESVGELGFSTAQLNQIISYWGTVSVGNTPALGGIPVLLGVPAGGYAGGVSLWGNIDGVNVEMERLLIRFIMTQFVGGFVTNNQWAAIGATYTNPTPNPITVRLNYGAAGNFAAGNPAAVWGVGQAW